MPTYFNNLSTLLLELPFYLLTCLLTQLPTYIHVYFLCTHLPTYPLCLLTYLHLLHSQIPNYLPIHFFQPHPPNPTYLVIKLHPSSWMMNIGPHM
jgi:hypothetical protein